MKHSFLRLYYRARIRPFLVRLGFLGPQAPNWFVVLMPTAALVAWWRWNNG